MEQLLRAFVSIFLAMEEVQRDPHTLEVLDRELEDVFATLSTLDGEDNREIRRLLEIIRSESRTARTLEGIDLILRNLP